MAILYYPVYFPHTLKEASLLNKEAKDKKCQQPHP